MDGKLPNTDVSDKPVQTTGPPSEKGPDAVPTTIQPPKDKGNKSASRSSSVSIGPHFASAYKDESNLGDVPSKRGRKSRLSPGALHSISQTSEISETEKSEVSSHTRNTRRDPFPEAKKRGIHSEFDGFRFKCYKRDFAGKVRLYPKLDETAETLGMLYHLWDTISSTEKVAFYEMANNMPPQVSTAKGNLMSITKLAYKLYKQDRKWFQAAVTEFRHQLSNAKLLVNRQVRVPINPIDVITSEYQRAGDALKEAEKTHKINNTEESQRRLTTAQQMFEVIKEEYENKVLKSKDSYSNVAAKNKDNTKNPRIKVEKVKGKAIPKNKPSRNIPLTKEDKRIVKELDKSAKKNKETQRSKRNKNKFVKKSTTSDSYVEVSEDQFEPVSMEGPVVRKKVKSETLARKDYDVVVSSHEVDEAQSDSTDKSERLREKLTTHYKPNKRYAWYLKSFGNKYFSFGVDHQLIKTAKIQLEQADPDKDQRLDKHYPTKLLHNEGDDLVAYNWQRQPAYKIFNWHIELWLPKFLKDVTYPDHTLIISKEIVTQTLDATNINHTLDELAVYNKCMNTACTVSTVNYNRGFNAFTSNIQLDSAICSYLLAGKARAARSDLDFPQSLLSTGGPPLVTEPVKLISQKSPTLKGLPFSENMIRTLIKLGVPTFALVLVWRQFAAQPQYQIRTMYNPRSMEHFTEWRATRPLAISVLYALLRGLLSAGVLKILTPLPPIWTLALGIGLSTAGTLLLEKPNLNTLQSSQRALSGEQANMQSLNHSLKMNHISTINIPESSMPDAIHSNVGLDQYLNTLSQKFISSPGLSNMFQLMRVLLSFGTNCVSLILELLGLIIRAMKALLLVNSC